MIKNEIVLIHISSFYYKPNQNQIKLIIFIQVIKNTLFLKVPFNILIIVEHIKYHMFFYLETCEEENVKF